MSGQKIFDIVGNIRVDQAGGSAQIMGGLHQVGARYYAGATPGFANCVANTTTCDHPSDEWGWGVGGGLTLKRPWGCQGHPVRRHRLFEGRWPASWPLWQLGVELHPQAGYRV